MFKLFWSDLKLFKRNEKLKLDLQKSSGISVRKLLAQQNSGIETKFGFEIEDFGIRKLFMFDNLYYSIIKSYLN